MYLCTCVILYLSVPSIIGNRAVAGIPLKSLVQRVLPTHLPSLEHVAHRLTRDTDLSQGPVALHFRVVVPHLESSQKQPNS